MNPSLLLIPDRYKAGKLYSQIPASGAGDFTVSRASTATRVNASGLIESVANDVPRFDYSGGVSCPALLREAEATNLLLRSEEFDNAYWTKSDLNITGTPPWVNVAVSPSGATNAEKLIANLSASTHTLRRNISVTNGITYTYSIYAKRGGYNFISLARTTASGTIPTGRISFNLLTGTASQAAAGLSGFKIENIGGNWYRCSVTFTATATGATDGISVYVADNSEQISFAGNNSDGVFVWGAQLETGSVATSYIPTVASTVTRLADTITATDMAGATVNTVVFEDGSTVETATTGTFTLPVGRINYAKQD